MVMGEGLAPNALELSEDQQDFASMVIESLGLPPEIADRTITHLGMTTTLQQGIGMCMDHIFAAGMDQADIELYVQVLLSNPE